MLDGLGRVTVGGLGSPPSNPTPNLTLTLGAGSCTATSPLVVAQNMQHASNSSGVRGAIASWWGKNREDIVVTLKVLAVVAVIAGLVAASVFSFGAAGVLISALTAASGFGAGAGAFALFGVGTGLALSAILTPLVAWFTKMHKCTNDNIGDTINFIGVTFIGSAIITGIGALEGVFFGIEAMASAKMGLGAVAGYMIFGPAGVVGAGIYGKAK